MNLACPECDTVYRIDPARVPRGGITARCRECAAVFRVESDAPHRPGEVQTAAAVEPAGSTTAPQSVPAPAEAVEGEPAEPDAPSGRGAEPSPEEPLSEEVPSGPSAPAFGPQDPGTRARRLARALVSDIKVYNPDKWQESRQQDRLRKDFRDEILKSWDEYVEQVGEEMAKKTPYFRDALNEILAGGEHVF